MKISKYKYCQSGNLLPKISIIILSGIIVPCEYKFSKLILLQSLILSENVIETVLLLQYSLDFLGLAVSYVSDFVPIAAHLRVRADGQ